MTVTKKVREGTKSTTKKFIIRRAKQPNGWSRILDVISITQK